MQEKRRHQRIRFDEPLPIRIGHQGERANGEMLNLSVGGLMFRSKLALTVGETIGCEFRVFSSPLIDLVAVVASRVGDGLYGARFQAGPLSERLIEGAIDGAVALGRVSIISIHDLPGGKVLRVAGALTGNHRNDFMHGVERVGVDEIDLSGVTLIDAEGISMCQQALARGVRAELRSSCVDAVWRV
jgi:hypothetical protein